VAEIKAGGRQQLRSNRAAVVKLEDYSIDDQDAQRQLNATYEATKANYIVLLLLLRSKVER
jgi:hypothetical protein